MKKNTINAVMDRIHNGESQFYLGKYWYENCGNGILRRREQSPGRLPTTDWELIANWDPEQNTFVFM